MNEWNPDWMGFVEIVMATPKNPSLEPMWFQQGYSPYESYSEDVKAVLGDLNVRKWQILTQTSNHSILHWYTYIWKLFSWRYCTPRLADPIHCTAAHDKQVEVLSYSGSRYLYPSTHPTWFHSLSMCVSMCLLFLYYFSTPCQHSGIKEWKSW